MTEYDKGYADGVQGIANELVRQNKHIAENEPNQLEKLRITDFIEEVSKVAEKYGWEIFSWEKIVFDTVDDRVKVKFMPTKDRKF